MRKCGRTLQASSFCWCFCGSGKKVGNGGVYGPFLDLAKASEGEDGEALAEQAGMLGLSAEQFNRAQMQALAFADTMEL